MQAPDIFRARVLPHNEPSAASGEPRPTWPREWGRSRNQIRPQELSALEKGLTKRRQRVRNEPHPGSGRALSTRRQAKSRRPGQGRRDSRAVTGQSPRPGRSRTLWPGSYPSRAGGNPASHAGARRLALRNLPGEQQIDDRPVHPRRPVHRLPGHSPPRDLVRAAGIDTPAGAKGGHSAPGSLQGCLGAPAKPSQRRFCASSRACFPGCSTVRYVCACSGP